jgi:hypothetical protein
MSEIAMVAVVFGVLLVGAVIRVRTSDTVGSRLTIRWGDAWLKAGVIVSGIALFVVYVPSTVMALDAVTELDGAVQELVGTAVWGAGLLGSLVALIWAQRRELL